LDLYHVDFATWVGDCLWACKPSRYITF